MPKKKEKLVIIDGNALIHRSFHALPITMKTSKGETVNAVFGFLTGLLKSIKDLKPDYLLATFDMKGETFRHKKYKEYKATRTKAPDELYSQIPRVKELVKAFNIPIYEKAEYEADDLIGTICAKTNSGIEKIIVTGDMDILQLIDDSTKVYRMSRGVSDYVLFGKKEVKEKYLISPKQVIDYKALKGDTADNIPGVKGVGDKTAITLLGDFKNLDGIYKNINSDKIKDRVRKLLIEHKEEAYLSHDLATIIRDVPIDFNLKGAHIHDFDKEKIIALLTELEFKSLLAKVRDLKNAGVKKGEVLVEDKFERNNKKFNYTLVDNEEKFKKFFSKLRTKKAFAFDVETTGVDPLVDDLLGISFSWKEGEAYYVRIKKHGLGAGGQGARERGGDNLFNYQDKNVASVDEEVSRWLKDLKTVFVDSKIKKYAHNMKFDMRFVERAIGEELKGIDFDTMIAAYLLNPGSRQLNLDTVSFQELGHEKISKEDLIGKGKDQITFSEVSEEKMSLYSCEDADCTFQLANKLKKQIKAQNLEKLMTDIEMPLVAVLARMENNGIEVNRKFLEKMSQKMNGDIVALEKKIHDLAGCSFNIKSTKQLKEILFEKLEIPFQGIKKTKTGFSTAFEELEKIKDLHPIIEYIQEYRELTKLTSTYIDALPELINKNTGRVHTSFNQTVTATGRLSSTYPNLQNIPTRTKLGREIRKAFVVPKGFKLVAIDYSQVELRVAAHLSGDKTMIRAFREGKDIHLLTAATINKIKPEEVTRKMRNEAKAVNFGVLYGQGVHGLSRGAGITFLEAKEFINEYFENFKDVKNYLDSQIRHAQEKGYVETLFKRQRFLPEINSKMPIIKKTAERMAVNTPIQGTAADILKMAMIEVDRILKKYSEKNILAKMLLQVHDELLFEIEEKHVSEVAKKIKATMEGVVKLQVPIVADVKIGNNWGDMKKLEL